MWKGRARPEGPQSDLAILLTHGYASSSHMWAGQVAALEDRYRVITWDERGFGRTDHDGEPFSYRDSASDFLAALPD